MSGKKSNFGKNLPSRIIALLLGVMLVLSSVPDSVIASVADIETQNMEEVAPEEVVEEPEVVEPEVVEPEVEEPEIPEEPEDIQKEEVHSSEVVVEQMSSGEESSDVVETTTNGQDDVVQTTEEESEIVETTEEITTEEITTEEIITEENNILTNEAYGVSIELLDDEALGAATELIVEDVTSSINEAVPNAIKASENYTDTGFQYKGFKMYLSEEDKEVVLAGKAKVTINIFAPVEGATYGVYKMKDSEPVKVDTNVSESKITFETTSLGSYCVTIYKEEVVTEVINDEFDVTITAKTEDALKEVSDIKVEDKTQQVADTTINQIVEKESIQKEEVVTKTLNIELADATQSEVQPEGTVTVSMKIPEDMDPTTFALYYIGDGDAMPIKVNGKVEDGYFIFDRTHFCQFCAVASGIDAGEDYPTGNIGWYVQDTTASTFYISTGADLRGLQALVERNVVYDPATGEILSSGSERATRQNFSSKTIVMVCDINMNSEEEFPAIGNESYYFSGTFDGNGHAIRNISIVQNPAVDGFAGLFYYIKKDACIKNLGMEHVKVTLSTINSDKMMHAAPLVADGINATVENVYVYDSAINLTGSAYHVYVGGVIEGITNTGSFRNVYSYDFKYDFSDLTITYNNYYGVVCATKALGESIYRQEGGEETSTGSGDCVTAATNAEFSSTGSNGVAAKLNRYSTETLGEGYSGWTVSNGHPVLTGENVSTSATVEAKVANAGEVSSASGKVKIGNGTAATTASSKIYMAYGGLDLVATPSSADYTFVGWFDNIEGTGDALSTELTYHVDEIVDKTYYAIFTGGPYSITVATEGTGTVSITGSTETSIHAPRNSTVTVHAVPGEGYAFAGWFEVDTVETTTANGRFVSDSKADSCSYAASLTGDIILKALFTEGVTIQAQLTDDSTEDMGTAEVVGGDTTAKGSLYTLKATPASGYTFVGWYETASVTEGSEPISRDATYLGTIAADYSGAAKTFYARFVIAEAANIVKTTGSNIVSVSDPGNTLKKIVYQYSGTEAYEYATWYKYYRNGRGYDENGEVKADYASHTVEYGYNGTAGYKSASSELPGMEIKLPYVGHYTFLLYGFDGSIIPIQIEMVSSDITADQYEPTVTKSNATLTIDAKGNTLTNAYYQLTSVNVSASTCPIEFTTWYRYGKTGQAEDVIASNGDYGYHTLGANCDGMTVDVDTAGWYTFYIKYGNGKTKPVYVQVTAEDIANAAGTIITTMANYTKETTAYAVFSVRTVPVTNATKYGLKIGDNYYEMTGSYQGKTYLVNASNLTAETDYTVTPVAYVSGSWTINGSPIDFTTASRTTSTNMTGGYYGNTPAGVSYAVSGTNIDIQGVDRVKTTYSNRGWSLSNSNSNVQVVPAVSIITGRSGSEYVQMKYIVRNNTANAISGYKFGISSDCMIGTNDYAPVYKTEYGLRITDGATSFAMFANSNDTTDGLGGKSTTCSTKWFGHYGSRTSNVYNEVSTTSLTNTDSGAAVSWQNITLAPGEVKEFNVVMGVVGTGVLNAPVVSEPNVSQNGNQLSVYTSGTTSAVNTLTSITYQYSSSNVTAATCPYTWDTADTDYSAFKQNGLNYRGINGLNGYKIMTVPLVEDGEGKNNTVSVTDAGWYTFIIKYDLTTYPNPSDLSDFSTTHEIEVISIKITEDDLSSVPMLQTVDNVVTIFNNYSGLSSITYQLSDTDDTQTSSPFIYTTWYRYGKNGQGFAEDGSEKSDKDIFTRVNGASGYNTFTKNLTDNGTNGCRSFALTEAGWYTFILKYKDASDNTVSAIKYVLMTQEMVNTGGPQIGKNNNVVTINDNRSNLTGVTYQLTTRDLETYSTEDAFMQQYGYGSGYYYTTAASNLYKTSNTTSNWLIYTRIGRYATPEEFVANTPSDSLKTTNGSNGYKNVTANVGATLDGKQLLFKTAGWYTFRMEYGDNLYAFKYIEITEEDLNNTPIVTLDSATGIATVNANGYHISSAYSQYSSDQVSQSVCPFDYSTWYAYYKHGQDYSEVNGTSGYKKVAVGAETDSTAQVALTTAGWYTFVINYDGGQTVAKYVKLATTSSLPVIAQVVGDEVTEDNRYMLEYTDTMINITQNITKYAYGYAGDTEPTGITTWYKMTQACADIKTVTTPVAATETGRTFNMVVNKPGWYVVMVNDYYYGMKFYTYQLQDNITARESTDVYAPRLTIAGATVSAAVTNGSIMYMKDSLSDIYTSGSTLKLFDGGARIIDVIDSEGRFFAINATIYGITVDKATLVKRIAVAQNLVNKSTSVEDTAYDTTTDAGTWTKATQYTALEQGIITASGWNTNIDATQVQVNDAVLALNTLITDFNSNTKTISAELVSVTDSNITITAPTGTTLSYVIYNSETGDAAEDGSRPIVATIWNSWAGICSETYSKIMTFADSSTYALTNVEDGVYTFQIKAGDTVYYRNAVVATGSNTDLSVSKDMLGGSVSGSYEGYIGEAQTLYDAITSKTNADGIKPYVSDTLYASLGSEITAAKAIFDAATSNDVSTVTKVVNEAAKIHNLIRQINASKTTTMITNATTIQVVDDTTGQVKATNTSNNLTKLFVTKGTYTNWNAFSATSYITCTIENTSDESQKFSNFNVSGDGIYTAYLKYANGEYEFKNFTLSGFVYPYQTSVSNGVITVTMDSGTAEMIALAYGEKNYYKAADFKQSATEVSTTNFNAMGSGTHTVYVKSGDISYISTVTVDDSPMITVADVTGNGRNVTAMSSSDKVVWVAYAEGSCSTWTAMLQTSGGVHYIAQNEVVTISSWTDAGTAYTFFFKGAEGQSDYIISTSSSGIASATVNNSYTTE